MGSLKTLKETLLSPNPFLRLSISYRCSFPFPSIPSPDFCHESQFQAIGKRNSEWFPRLGFLRWTSSTERGRDGEEEAEEVLRQGGNGFLESYDEGQAFAAVLDPAGAVCLGYWALACAFLQLGAPRCCCVGDYPGEPFLLWVRFGEESSDLGLCCGGIVVLVCWILLNLKVYFDGMSFLGWNSCARLVSIFSCLLFFISLLVVWNKGMESTIWLYPWVKDFCLTCWCSLVGLYSSCCFNWWFCA